MAVPGRWLWVTSGGQRRARPQTAQRIIGALPRPLQRRRAFVLLPLALLALVGLMKLRGGTPPPPEPFAALAANELTITTPESIAAGDVLDLSVTGDFETDTEVTLLVETGYGHWQMAETTTDGVAAFSIEPVDTPASGVITLTALAGDRTGHATVEQTPGLAVDPLELFLGPRTIEATNTTATMIVVVAEDEFGNPVQDGTEVEVRVTRPDLSAQSFTLQTDGLLAWSRIISETRAGRSKVAVTVDDGRGQELNFLEVAGSPVPFLVEAIDPPVPADGRSLIRVQTTELVDEFDNVLPDGIKVFADIIGPGGTRRLHSQVIKGRAEFTLEAPSRPGTETVTVHASGTISPPLLIAFGSMVTSFDVAATTDIDGVRLAVGPIISTLGAYVPDGTPVIVGTEFGESEHPTFDGEAEIVIPATSNAITVTVLGFERTIQVDP